MTDTAIQTQTCDVRHADVTTLRDWLAQGQLDPVELVDHFTANLNRQHHIINAATSVMDSAAREQAYQPLPGPLSGIPCSVKETLGIGGLPITAGSMRMTPWVPETDSMVVERLKRAGAILLARGNVPEFAMTAESSNPRFGTTNNPLDPTRVAGGSSGGEAALVASGSVAFGVGSDILGSIRIPAACCGVVGFKPASHAVPKARTWPALDGFIDSWLAIGPITRTVRDAKLVYEVLSATTLPAPAPIQSARLILPDGFPFTIESACIQQALDHSIDVLRTAGMQPEGGDFSGVAEAYKLIAPTMLHYLEPGWHTALNQQGRFSLLAETLAQLRGQPTIDGGLYRWVLLGKLLGGFLKPRSEAGVQKLIDRYLAIRTITQSMLGTNGILVLPAMGMLPPKHGDMNRLSLKPGLNRLISPLSFGNYCDLPTIAIPAPRFKDATTGLIPSVMAMCAPGAEAMLFAVAEELEQALK
ncbi:amidase [Burkholderiaceae bacterium DAT-1]|nr:amidase [Burkholderiaceae bacterium DAT-1]